MHPLENKRKPLCQLFGSYALLPTAHDAATAASCLLTVSPCKSVRKSPPLAQFEG